MTKKINMIISKRLTGILAIFANHAKTAQWHTPTLIAAAIFCFARGAKVSA